MHVHLKNDNGPDAFMLVLNEWTVFGFEPFWARHTQALKQFLCALYSVLS